jgi:hypothetical protein
MAEEPSLLILEDQFPLAFHVVLAGIKAPWFQTAVPDCALPRVRSLKRKIDVFSLGQRESAAVTYQNLHSLR